MPSSKGRKGLRVGGFVLANATNGERGAEKSRTWEETQILSRLCAASSYCLPAEGEDPEHLLRRSHKQVEQRKEKFQASQS